MLNDVNWSDYLTGNECPICHQRIARRQEWINCDGWAEHRVCHDADIDDDSPVHDAEGMK